MALYIDKLSDAPVAVCSYWILV